MREENTRERLAIAWREWEQDENDFSLPDEIYGLVARIRQAAKADNALLAAWDRWQADPDNILPPRYLHTAFADWIERNGS